MSNVKRTIVGLLCVVLLVCSFIAFTRFTTVNAETAKYFSAEEYTQDDHLLNADGSLSSKTIFTFADEVHYSEMAAFIPDLSKVVPLQYLENDGTYSYFGKEYGFYMVVEDPYVDLLLVDINYELEDGKLYGEYNRDNVYTMKIEPILQQSFYTRSDVADGLTWQIYPTIDRPVYYIMNPRFVTSISNENALNQGDLHYSKQEDEGIIIQQTMVEYQKMLQPGTIGLEIIPEFIASMALDAIVDALDATFFHGFLGYMQSIIDFAAGHCDSRQNDSFVTGKTISVFTEQAKETQKEDIYREGYSRTTYFYPEEEIILSEYSESYAEFSILVSDADYRTRLNQICEFDIGRSIGHEGTPHFFDGNWNDPDDESFFFSNTKVLFDDESPEFIIEENNIDGEELNVYMLTNGKQNFEFTPEYSGYYNFDVANSSTTLTVKDSKQKALSENDGGYRLAANEKYIITIGAPNYKVISSLRVSIKDSTSSGTLSAGEKIILKLGVNTPKVYTVSTSHSQVVISDFLIQANNKFTSYSNFIGYVPNSVVDVPLDTGYYYLILHNTAAVSEGYNIVLDDCADGAVGSVNTIKTDGDNYKFIKLPDLSGGEYVISADGNEDVWFKVFGENLEPVKLTGSRNVYRFDNDYMVIYVGVYSKESVDVIVNPTGMAYQWKINDKNVNINERTSLEIGDEYSIALYVNGIKQENGYTMNCSVAGIVFDKDSLTLRVEYFVPIDANFEIVYDNDNILCELMLSTKCDNGFNGIESVKNDELLSFTWVKTENLISFTYTLSGEGESEEYVVDTRSNIVGVSYDTDITSQVEDLFDGVVLVTITITEYEVQTPIGIGERNVNQSVKFNSAYGTGSGVQGDPYTISCVRHFKNLELSESNSNYFEITEYLSLEGNVIDTFYGVIDNDELTIIGWKPTDSREMGIILHNFGIIRNIQVNIDYNFNLTGSYGHTAGGIVCYNESTGLIEDCSVTMLRGSNLGFTSIVGGIVGVNDGTIRDCWATADVTTCGTFGVIAGINYGTITGSCGMGNIIQKVDTYEGYYELSQVGGIAGINGAGGKISNCVGGTWDDSYLKVVIDVEYVDDEDLSPYSGPIAGENKGEISNCSNNGYSIDTGNLHSWWAWFHTYDQLKNINNTI